MKKRKFTPDQIRYMRKLKKVKWSCQDIATKFNSTKSNIAKIMRGEIYSEVL